MTRVTNAILRAAVACYHSRKARLIGILLLVTLALLALATTVSGLLTAREVTGPGNPVPAVPNEPYLGCDCSTPGRFI
jgi:hypothetical protein